MGNTDILMMVGSDDPLYNMRQVEQMIYNNLSYAWFDPMTFYPTGSPTFWGSLFPAIVAICCVVIGATTRPEIIATGLLIPPIVAAIVVAIMYWVGKSCGDWKTGLLASGFTAIVTGQFLYRSLYGYMDHHIAEVLFSTLFCLLYICALQNHTHKNAVAFSALAGVAYLLGLLVMPTMILFAMIAGIFTIIQFVFDFYRGRDSRYLVVSNGVVFTIASIGLALYGIRVFSMDLSMYSIGHIFAYVGLIVVTILLYLLSQRLKGEGRHHYPAVIAACGIGVGLLMFALNPTIVANLFAFFGQAPITSTVMEARGWDMGMAWLAFNYGLILMVGGILVMAYNNLRDEHPEQVFVLVWSFVILLSTIQHIRYEYYLAINVALLSAVCVSWVWGRGKDDLYRVYDIFVSSSKDWVYTQPPNYRKIGLTIVILLVGVLFVYNSVAIGYSGATNLKHMNPEWRESLEWLGNNTPDTGVDYYTIYDPTTFKYPNESYGVMSWWDYGHMITYISKRIPNANPFQQGVVGGNGAAAYFMSTSEDVSNGILDRQNTRYVITDTEMSTGKFWAMATWYNSSVGTAPYQMTLLARRGGGVYEPAVLNKQSYYLTTISRLHNFDGSMTSASDVFYVEYTDGKVVVVNTTTATDAKRRADEYNRVATDGNHAVAISQAVILPLETVPSLRHYRLIHESPKSWVKVFEYVKGAHIKGNGTIEVPVVTNTGREFTYRQESIDGEFVVPYAGTYRVVGGGVEYEVGEEEVNPKTNL